MVVFAARTIDVDAHGVNILGLARALPQPLAWAFEFGAGSGCGRGPGEVTRVSRLRRTIRPAFVETSVSPLPRSENMGHGSTILNLSEDVACSGLQVREPKSRAGESNIPDPV